jgi:hypothetical protein
MEVYGAWSHSVGNRLDGALGGTGGGENTSFQRHGVVVMSLLRLASCKRVHVPRCAMSWRKCKAQVDQILGPFVWVPVLGAGRWVGVLRY